MRKTLVFLMLICLLIAFVSCNSDPVVESSTENPGSVDITSIREILYDMSVLSNFKANVSDKTVAIGMQESKALRGTRGLDDYIDMVLVKQDEGNHSAEAISFEVVKDVDANGQTISSFDGSALKKGDIVTQGIIPGKIDKVYVSGDFTFISYLTVDAYKLMNYKNNSVSEQSDGSKWYNGSFEISSSNNDGSGENEWVSWSFGDHSETIYISYYKNKWWNDDQGQYRNSQISRSEDLSLRNTTKEEQAKNEASGVLKYDTYDYYTSMFRQSFIIDNNTGLIYPINNGLDFSFNAGIPIDKQHGPVSLEVKDDGSLEIESLISNHDIFIYDAFKDSNGTNYLLCDSAPSITDNLVLFRQIGEYVPTKDGRILHITYGDTNNCCMKNVTSLKLIENGAERKLTNSDNIDIHYSSYRSDYWSDMPQALREYNEKINGVDYWSFVNNNYGSQYEFLSISNGYLYSCYSNGANSLYYAITDINTCDTQIMCFEGWNSSSFFAALDDKNIMAATKQNSSDSTYSLYVINLDDVNSKNAFSNLYNLTSGGANISEGSWDTFQKYYSDIIGTSIGWNSDLYANSDFNLMGNKEIVGETTEYNVRECDYNWFKKELINTTFGFDDELGNQDGVEWTQSDSKHYLENTSQVQMYDYVYTWTKFTQKEKTFGFNQEMYDKYNGKYECGKTRSGIVYWKDLNGYFFYDANGKLLDTSISKANPPENTVTIRYDYGKIHFPNGVFVDYDREYLWGIEEKITTFGYNPDYDNQGYNFNTGDYKLGTPEFLYDYDYTYYTVTDLGTTHGYHPDPEWDFQYDYNSDYSYYYADSTYKTMGYEYTYYKYKDGYDYDTLWNLYCNGGSIKYNDEPILKGISINSSDWSRYNNALMMEFTVKTVSENKKYRIVFDKDAKKYMAVETGFYVAEKVTIVLQPINK